MSSFLERLSRSKHFRFGVPFFAFIFGGQYALRKFREVRYDVNLNPSANKNLIKPEEAFADVKNKSGARIFEHDTRTTEEELEALDKELDTDNWEQKRGPRPWEGTVENREIRRVKKPMPTVRELLGN